MCRRYRNKRITPVVSVLILTFIFSLTSFSSFADSAFADSALAEAVAKNSLPKGIITLDGRMAPPLILKDMEENIFDLSKFKGQWVFVHFWATWCGPCRREMPTIQAMSEKFEDTRLKIVLVNTAESEDTIFNFLGIVAPDLNPLLDTDGLATEAWQPRGLPATFFVSPNGKLRYLALGGRDWNKKEYLKFLEQFK